MRLVTWIIAPLAGLALAVALAWFVDGNYMFLLGAVLAPAVTVTYAAAKRVPPRRGWALALGSLVVSIVLIGVALAVFVIWALSGVDDFD